MPPTGAIDGHLKYILQLDWRRRITLAHSEV